MAGRRLRQPQLPWGRLRAAQRFVSETGWGHRPGRYAGVPRGTGLGLASSWTRC